MNTSWTECWSHFKSPLRVVVQILLRSRETLWKSYQRQKQKLHEVNCLAARWKVELERQRKENRGLRQQVRRLETEKQIIQAQATIRLPDDPPVNQHGYGSRMASLAVNLARAVGLRGSETVLKIMFEWLEVEQQIPHWTTIRSWLQRLGVAALNEPVEQADDWVWLVDHSNQIGPE